MKPADKAPGGGKRRKPQETRKACPLCGKPARQAYRPFCSRRCADIDLGRWLNGGYAVPGEPAGGEGEDDETSV